MLEQRPEMVASASAPVTATSARSAKRSAWPQQRRLQSGCARVVPDDAVPELERPPVGGSRRRDPELREAGTATILDGRQQAGPDDGDLVHSRVKRTRSPLVSSAGAVRCGSNSASDVRPMSRQPPGDSRG